MTARALAAADLHVFLLYMTHPPEFVQATWYACIANAEFMLNDVQNESFAEQLRERKRLFAEKDKELDFFLVSEPTWLDEKFPAEAKRVGRPCVALVSPDKIWMR